MRMILLAHEGDTTFAKVIENPAKRFSTKGHMSREIRLAPRPSREEGGHNGRDARRAAPLPHTARIGQLGTEDDVN
jgi:hypothetical protein